MAVSSVVPATKARLLELFAASPELATVDRSWAAPAQILRESLYFGKTTGTSTLAGMRADRKQRNEDFTLQVVIDTAIKGRSAQEAETRAFELVSVIDDLLAERTQLQDDAGIGLDGILHAIYDGYTAGPDPDIEGWFGLIVASISVTARLV